ncbi:hypothetical protein ACFX2B_037238 [Malus domestica]
MWWFPLLQKDHRLRSYQHYHTYYLRFFSRVSSRSLSTTTATATTTATYRFSQTPSLLPPPCLQKVVLRHIRRHLHPRPAPLLLLPHHDDTQLQTPAPPACTKNSTSSSYGLLAARCSFTAIAARRCFDSSTGCCIH